MIQSLVLIVVAILIKFFPPKEINDLYGFRTKASMQNINTWKFANEYFATWMVRTSLMLCLIAIGIYAYSESFGLAEQFMIPLTIAGLLYLCFRTENAVKKYGSRL
jgi:uncharacterized membrane protein